MKKSLIGSVLLNSFLISYGYTDDSNSSNVGVGVGAGLGALALGGGGIAAATGYSKNKSKKRQEKLEKEQQLNEGAKSARFNYIERKNLDSQQEKEEAIATGQKNSGKRLENLNEKFKKTDQQGKAHAEFIEQHSVHANSILNAKNKSEKTQAITNYNEFLAQNQSQITENPEGHKLEKMVEHTQETLGINRPNTSKQERPKEGRSHTSLKE